MYRPISPSSALAFNLRVYHEFSTCILSVKRIIAVVEEEPASYLKAASVELALESVDEFNITRFLLSSLLTSAKTSRKEGNGFIPNYRRVPHPNKHLALVGN